MTKIRLIAALTILLCGLSAPRAEAIRYVALGDSYSSGTGTGTYYERTCRRSFYSYPYLLHRAHPAWRFAHAACSGAETGDVLASQVAALTPGTDWVTYTAGGNDAGFSRVIRECAPPWWASDCTAAIDAAQAFIRDELPARLDALNRAIATLAPSATVLVLGYPQLFYGDDCNPVTFFGPAEQARLGATGDMLAGALSRAASRAGPAFVFVEVADTFAGHALCDPDPWLNDLAVPLAESYHPTRRGQELGYLPVVRRALAGFVDI